MELVTGAIGSLLPKLGELLKEEYSLQKGVKQKIQSLARELEAAQAVLRKTGDVPPDELDELVRLWARDLREASYDMEDIIDAFLVRVDAPEPTDDIHMLRRLRKKVGKLFKKSKARREISSLIQDVNKKLEVVAASRGRYTLDNIAASPVSVATVDVDPRLLHMYRTTSELVGIEAPKQELMKKLSVGGDNHAYDKKMKIISIVGFGGLGKTTLAKAVYDQLKPSFQCAAFVPVGRNPDIKKVLTDILIGVDEDKYTYSKLNGLDENQLMGKLNEFVKENRCFIVIDDIWDKEPWKLIICALQGSLCGSRLVMTTRISNVATYGCDETYVIQPLSRDDAKQLLYARFADGEGRYFDTPSAEARDKILKKCGGVPLAIITIASVLASKPEEDWSEVYNSIGFGHEDNDVVDDTRRILSFSYYDLPSHLKPCLLYLSVFPEDYVIDKNILIWKWVGEGFIIVHKEQAAAGVGLFDLGERYFNELINRSMIQPKEHRYDGYVDACSVHDMVLDLIHSLSSNEKFITVLDGHERQKLPPGSIARRLALRCVPPCVPVHNGALLATIAVDKVRSLTANQCKFRAVCPRLVGLRSLAIERFDNSYFGDEGCDDGVKLDHLGSFLHLRYLRLQGGHITELPREVRYLKFLLILDLSGSRIEDLPKEVGQLTQLVCLRAGFSSSTVPAGVIGKLTCLQELWMNSPYDDPTAAMQFVKELGLLRELRVLWTFIDITSESMQRALLESLGNLHNIRDLTIHCASPFTIPGSWTGDDGAGFVTTTYRHLRRLSLDFFLFSRLPAWIKLSLTPNLSYLHLNVLAVKEQDMETLARLPELRSLRLYLRDDENRKIESIKIRDGGVAYFPKLRILFVSAFIDLHVSECNNVLASSSSSSIMPSLQRLEFYVHVRSHLNKLLLLGFGSLGRSSLQEVTARVYCGGARASEVEEAEAALMNAAAVHPNHPTLHTEWYQENKVLSPYQEACMDMKRNNELVNKAWKKLTNIVGSGHIRALRMPDPASSSSKVIRLLYTNDGNQLLALGSNAVHKLWKWEQPGRGKATTSVAPQLWTPKNGNPMTNDTANANPEEATACMAISYGRYLFSASGGPLSEFSLSTFEVLATRDQPPPTATSLAVYPQDRILAVGTDNSSIQIYYLPPAEDIRAAQVKMVLWGHQKKITGLAFSQLMNVLVSSDADAQVSVWSTGSWDKKKSRYLQPPCNYSGALVGDTTVQFHYDQTHILVVHETQLAIYDSKLKCLCSWFPRDALPAPISSAVYSSNGLWAYVGFCDGAIGVFEAESLALQCMIAPSAYIPSSVSSDGGIVYPMVVAANPWKADQMAVGMSDGAVYVLEPPLDDAGLEVGSSASSGGHPPCERSSSNGDGQQDV